MPCYDDRSANTEDNHPAINTQDRLDEVTQHLCFICNMLEVQEPGTLNVLLHINPDFNAWWQEHKSFDAKKAKG